MKSFLTLSTITVGLLFLTSCQTTETIVFSPYSLNKSNNNVYSAKTFMFKNYYFTYNNGEATLVYQQDKKLNNDSKPVFLSLKENSEVTKYQEFIDEDREIIVRIISDHEVRLRVNKSSYTLYNPNYVKEANADTDKILADIAIWRNSKY